MTFSMKTIAAAGLVAGICIGSGALAKSHDNGVGDGERNGNPSVGGQTAGQGGNAISGGQKGGQRGTEASVAGQGNRGGNGSAGQGADRR